MSLIPIGAADIKEYHGEEVPVKARLYANKSFKTSEGIFIQNGHRDDPDFYQEFDLTYDGVKVRIEAGDAYSTTDSDQPDATYDLDAYDADGGFLFHIFSRLVIVNVSPLTWDAIVEDSKSVRLKYPPTYMSTEAIEARFAQLTNTAFKASSTMIGTTKLDVDPVDLANPIAVGANSPLLLAGGALAGVGVYGRTRLDYAPVNPADPIAVGANSPRIGKDLAMDYSNSLAAAVTAIGSAPADLLIGQNTSVPLTLVVPANIRLVIRNLSLITVASGQTLTINRLAPVGNQQIFAGAGTVVLTKKSIPEFNLSWWGGIDETADMTGAINAAFANLSTNGGGSLYIPSGIWKTTGGHAFPLHSIVRGNGPDVFGVNGTKLLLTSGTAGYMFKILTSYRNGSLRDIVLDGGTTTTANLFWGNNPSGGDSVSCFEFGNVSFIGGGIGAVPQVLFDSPDGVGLLITHIKFDHCFWITPENGTSVKISDQNFDAIFIQPNCLVGKQGIAFDIRSATQVNLIAPSFGGQVITSPWPESVDRTITNTNITSGTKILGFVLGNLTPQDIGQRVVITGKLDSYITEFIDATTAKVNDNATATAVNANMDVYRRATEHPDLAKACIRTQAVHGNINIVGSQDEGLNYFILAEDTSHPSVVFNIQNSIIQGFIKTRGSSGSTINSAGNWYWSDTYTSDSPASQSVYSTGDIARPITLGPGRTIASPRLVGPETGLTAFEATTRLGSVPTLVSNIPHEFKFTHHANDTFPQLTESVVAIGVAFDKPWIRLGELASTDQFFTWYEARFNFSNGHMKWYGTDYAPGGYKSGFDFVSTDPNAVSIENTSSSLTSLILRNAAGSPLTLINFEHGGTVYWQIGSYDATHIFTVHNFSLGVDALSMDIANNNAQFNGNVAILTGKKLTVGGDATTAGLHITALAGDPSSPVDGDIWYNSTTGKFRGRAAGVNVDLH